MDKVTKPSIPYTGEIPNLSIGKAIYINGFTPSYCKRFTIDLVVCPRKNCDSCDDIILHISVRLLEEVIVLNSFMNNGWQEEIRSKCYLSRNRQFDLIVLPESQHYEVILDGKHVAEFKHRLPLQAVKGLSINGDVVVNYLQYYSMHSPSSKFSLVDRDLEPLYKPGMPLRHHFRAGLKSMLIKIVGRSFPGAKRFAIDFNTGANDIAMHFNARFDQESVVMNNKAKNIWGREEYGVMLFDTYGNFTLDVHVKNHEFQFVLNGQHCGAFRHRVHPIAAITSMDMHGDWMISNVQFY